MWRCKCDCGTEKIVSGGNLRSGQSQSCGCQGSRATIGDRTRTHGAKETRLYQTWSNMRGRCNNPNNDNYANYGGRGISVCEEWDDFSKFRDWALANGYTDILTIERKDVNGNYNPNNCTWADMQAQSENRRFVARAPNGRLWWHIARENGISQSAYRTRLFDGWPIEEAAVVPMGERRTNPNTSRMILVDLDGEKMPVTYAARQLGLSQSAIHQRAKRKGISLQSALDQFAKGS